MLRQLKQTYNEYPRQFWLMISGIVISTAGGSMIWPFVLIYATRRLDLPLGVVAPLISVNAGTGLLASFIAGTMADKIGRKTVMNISLTLSGISFLFLMNAVTYEQFFILMIVIGLSNPLYQVGADAMLADMIPPEKRTNAYAINRMAVNAAFALGPAVGGFLASTSYNLAFYGAASGFLMYSALLLVLAKETLVKSAAVVLGPISARQTVGTDGGYLTVFRDSSYILYASLMSLGLVAPSMLWILMPVYAKTNFGLPESQYGWIATTNALMCVFVQYSVSQVTARHKPLQAIAVGMLVYAVGTGSVALMTGFSGFWLSMVILTFGELILAPTASKYVADLAPSNLRGRYMSIYWIAWGLARTTAPLVGGALNDRVGPSAIWVGGLALGLFSTLGLLALSARMSAREPILTQP